MSERVLVTGGCGFIGANLIPKLLAQGCSVRVLDNLSRGDRDLLSGYDYQFHHGDIRDSKAVGAAVEGVDAVIHLAAYGSVVESITDPHTNFAVNAEGTLNLLEAVKNANVGKFIFASTGGALIGDATPPVNEESPPRPKSPYGASKLVGEGYCYAYAGSFGLPTVVLRFGNIYGPHSAHKKGAVTVFAKALLRDEPFVIYGDGTASRDFLYVDDLCAGLLSALQTDLPPATVMHLATGTETSVRELADTMRRAAGAADHPIHHESPRQGEVHRNFASYERAQNLIDFSPQVNLEAGIRRTWEWFQSQGKRALQVEATDS